MTEHLCTSDLHVHTNLSLCAPKTTTVASYLPHCSREGIEKLGISNHLYAANKEGIEGRSYLEHNLLVREELAKLAGQTDVRFLLGCECEVIWGRAPGLLPEEAPLYDYVLFASSHLFNIPHLYRNIDLDVSNAEKTRKVMLEQFIRTCKAEYPVPMGICHPLYPICCPWEQEVVDGMTYAQLRDCFSLAAERQVSIEIHACLYRNGTQLDGEGLSPSYLRMLAIAKECGCKFHFGADAHAPDAFIGKHRLLERAARRIGLTKDDLWHICQ